jgi:cell division protein ZapA (FtsZ GTPase activity inhibitor)
MKAVSVEIMGQSLVVRSDADDDWIRNVAHAVDEKIKRIRAGSQGASSVSLVILAALNFADELERLRNQHRELIDRIEAMNRRLSAAIDGAEPEQPGRASGRSDG